LPRPDRRLTSIGVAVILMTILAAGLTIWDSYRETVATHSYPAGTDAVIPEAAALANWRRQSAFIAIDALCTVLGFVVLIRALGSQFRELEQNRASLEVKNRELQQIADALRQSERRLSEKSQLLETT